MLEAMGLAMPVLSGSLPPFPPSVGWALILLKGEMQVSLVPLSLPRYFRELFYFRGTYWGAGHLQSEGYFGRGKGRPRQG